MASLLKYVQNVDHPACKLQGLNNEALHFGRADIDGMPFVGPPIPFNQEAEYEELTDVDFNSDVRIFDIGNPEERAAFRTVIEAAANGWYKIHVMQHEFSERPDKTKTVLVYCVWSAPVMRLNQQRAAARGLMPGAGM
jgi:hypothetical protein